MLLRRYDNSLPRTEAMRAFRQCKDRIFEGWLTTLFKTVPSSKVLHAAIQLSDRAERRTLDDALDLHLVRDK